MAARGGSSWVDIQQNAFTRWVNEHLKDRGYHVTNLQKDLCDGILLVNLLEIISGKSLGKYNRNPRIPAQKLENQVIALNFIKAEGLTLVNIGPEDIVDGRLKLILGLIWTLILRYQIKKGGGADENAKSELLKWVQSKIPEYNITGFQKDWNDGRAICALVNALEPGLCPNHRNLNPANALENATKGIDLGFNEMGIPKIVEAAEMNHPKVDELAMMTYISYYRDYEAKRGKRSDASRCRAYGPGLVEAIVNEPADFVVENPSGRGRLDVRVEGPRSQAPVNIVNNGDGTYKVSYNPKEPGTYRVHVTLDGEHIPGSVFTVRVLEQLSLGGEGKIRVFYTTTTSSNEKTRPMQELLEAKKVHLRPDFEPWIPVDIMERDDREAVFKKAGTRKLPIVFIDDVYTGDYQRIVELNDSGELDRLLKYNPNVAWGSGTSTSAPAKSAASAPTSSYTPPVKVTSAPAAAKSQPAASTGGQFCASCGTKFSAGAARFCSSCGKPRS